MTLISSPVSGRVVSLDDVADPVFSERIMGEGVAVLPSEGDIVSPLDGTIEKLFEGGHAFVIQNSDGLQVLVHVGLETVHLKGEGFTLHATDGTEVVAGDSMVTVDLDAMAARNIDMVSPVVVISGHPVEIVAEAAVNAGDALLRSKS